MILTTLCVLLKNDQILLAMKKRGFGAGKWNGCGGKINDKETITQAAVRELTEEIGVIADEKDLVYVADLTFYFESNPQWDTRVEVFTLGKWQNEPVETEEMKPQWFAFNKIPYDQMWMDDRHWLPKVLEGKRLKGIFYFNSDGSNLKNFTIDELET